MIHALGRQVCSYGNSHCCMMFVVAIGTEEGL